MDQTSKVWLGSSSDHMGSETLIFRIFEMWMQEDFIMTLFRAIKPYFLNGLVMRPCGYSEGLVLAIKTPVEGSYIRNLLVKHLDSFKVLD